MTATYTLQCGKYDNVNSDYPQYTTEMSPTGSFTTAEALANDLTTADIKDKITAWSFFDGVTTYDNTNSTINRCEVSTIPWGSDAIVVINCFVGVTLNDNSGSFCMNNHSMGDAFFVNVTTSQGATTVAQRWPTTFTSM